MTPCSSEYTGIRINLILTETRFIGVESLCALIIFETLVLYKSFTYLFTQIFAAGSVGLSSFKFSWWAPKPHVFLNRVRNGRSRSSKVVDFGTNRKRLCHFLLVINSNLGPILPRFRDIAGILFQRSVIPNRYQIFVQFLSPLFSLEFWRSMWLVAG